MMAKILHFFGNTKLFCHFLLADIEKVLYIYMPFYDGMATFIYKVETAAQKKMFHGADYVFMADMWNPKHLSGSRHLWVPILGKWCSGVEKIIKNTAALLVSNLIFIYLQLLS